MRTMAESTDGRYQCFLLEEGELEAAVTVICLDRDDFDTASAERQQELWDQAERTLHSSRYDLFALVDTHEDRLVGKAMIEYDDEDFPEITGLHVLDTERGKRLINIAYDACILNLQELGFQQAMVRISPGNRSSLNAARRNGFAVFSRDTGVEPDLAHHRFLKRDIGLSSPGLRYGTDGPDAASEGFDHYTP